MAQFCRYSAPAMRSRLPNPPPAALEEALAILVRIAQPDRVILFGSQARGDARPDSDFDLLIVQPEAAAVHRSRWQELRRLREALRSLPLAKDLLLFRPAEFDYWRDSLNHVVGRAIRDPPGVVGEKSSRSPQPRCRLESDRAIHPQGFGQAAKAEVGGEARRSAGYLLRPERAAADFMNLQLSATASGQNRNRRLPDFRQNIRNYPQPEAHQSATPGAGTDSRGVIGDHGKCQSGTSTSDDLRRAATTGAGGNDRLRLSGRSPANWLSPRCRGQRPVIEVKSNAPTISDDKKEHG